MAFPGMAAVRGLTGHHSRESSLRICGQGRPQCPQRRRPESESSQWNDGTAGPWKGRRRFHNLVKARDSPTMLASGTCGLNLPSSRKLPCRG